MKKLLFILIAMLSILLVACGVNDDTSANNEQEETSKEEETNQESDDNQSESPEFDEEKTATAEAFLDKIVNEQITEAYNDLSEQMKEEITEEQLEEVWNTVTSDIGSFVSFELVSSTEEQGINIFIYDGLFAGGNAQFNVALDNANEIVGFYIYPK
ncbi:hypothetical protein AQ616_07840 [Oceanobacillus sp. E9]|uniref:DUF3887 domain-containing protein n=1 Tax=Oceanobacillus TaxID=182709 RepID=UPI00084EA7B2|nr:MULTISPECIES: DUF3887 domain-containing protein [Oceanobacillus]OEH54949.1 hypothetical protein AQ616_07840 [Oceanobacillus sp. E9]